MSFSLSQLFSKAQTATANVAGNTKSTVGIDIGSASVKVVEIEQTEQALMLRTYGQLQLGPYENKQLGQAVQLDTKQKTEAVVDVIREAQVNTHHGALAMPLSSSFMTVIPIRLTDGEDIESRIPVEAKKFVPVPLTDVTLDWTELPVSDDRVQIPEVMLAAIENKALDEYKAVLGAVGMTSEPAEIEAFSLLRSLWKQSDTTLAIIDIGARTTKLYIARDETIERIHRVAVGGEHITVRISELLHQSFAEAENNKRSYTKESPEARDIHKTMASVIDSPLSEFRRLIQQYEARIGEPIARVVFSGGVSASPYFLAYAKDRIGREVEIGNPFGKVAYPAFMEDTLTQITPLFGVSLGAALRQFQYTN